MMEELYSCDCCGRDIPQEYMTHSEGGPFGDVSACAMCRAPLDYAIGKRPRTFVEYLRYLDVGQEWVREDWAELGIGDILADLAWRGALVGERMIVGMAWEDWEDHLQEVRR